MSIYVDQLRETEKTRQFPFTWGCHLMADSEDELYLFARNELWIPVYKLINTPIPHYDLIAEYAQAVLYAVFLLLSIYGAFVWLKSQKLEVRR